MITLRTQRKTKTRWMIRKKDFVGEIHDFEVNSPIYFKPNKLFF